MKNFTFIIFMFLFIRYCNAALPTCGSYSLLIIAKERGISVNQHQIQRLAGYDVKSGTTLLGLKHASEKLGLPVVSAKLSIDQLRHVDGPAIAWVDGNHFLVVHGRSLFGFGKDFIIEDPPKGKQTLSAAELKRRWNGEALVYSKRLVRELRNKKEKEKRARHRTGPSISFDETAEFFGTVSEGEKVTVTFPFTNTGTDTLTIRTRSSCSCTAATGTGDRIAPGGTGSITVAFDTKGRAGFTSQTTMVLTNDPANKNVKLVVAGAVARGVKTLPERLYLGDIPRDMTISREVLLLGEGVSPLAIRKIDTPAGFTVTSKAAASDSVHGDYLPIAVSFAAGSDTKEINGRIAIVMQSGKTLEIPVSGTVVSSYKAYPPVMVFTGETPSDISIIIAPTGSSMPTVRIGDTPWLSIRLAAASDSTWKLTARLDPSKGVAPKKGEVTLFTEQETKPSFVVPFVRFP